MIVSKDDGWRRTRAGIAALGTNKWQTGVFINDGLQELDQVGVDKVLDDADAFGHAGFDPGRHVELEHGADFTAVGLVRLSNGSGA